MAQTKLTVSWCISRIMWLWMWNIMWNNRLQCEMNDINKWELNDNEWQMNDNYEWYFRVKIISGIGFLDISHLKGVHDVSMRCCYICLCTSWLPIFFSARSYISSITIITDAKKYCKRVTLPPGLLHLHS